MNTFTSKMNIREWESMIYFFLFLTFCPQKEHIEPIRKEAVEMSSHCCRQSLIHFVTQNPELFDKGNKNDKVNSFKENI